MDRETHDVFDREVAADTDYALGYIAAYEQFLGYFGLPTSGTTILELGPGRNFGPQLVMAERGARMILADLYLTGFGRPYHPAIYKSLNARLPNRSLLLETAENGYADVPLRLLHEPAEALRSVENGSVDFVYSNATLEHVFDVARTAQETARVMRDGGCAAHQVDLRYHFHDFQRPLDHLIVSDDEFLAEATASKWVCGNRVRSLEFVGHFESVGLRVVERETNLRCDKDYFVDAVRRLRASGSSYRLWPVDDLLRISARFYLKKETGRAAEDTMERGRDLLQTLATLKAAAHA
ncbi:MAG: methyltransferase domain-containing protein [Parafilimonas terrae]|nr:methyltransferase domain-containing protein [Parafilimonas terrae]